MLKRFKELYKYPIVGDVRGIGLIAGGLLGVPMAKCLIEKKDIKPSDEDYEFQRRIMEESGNGSSSEVSIRGTMKHIALVSICMTIGSIAADLISKAMDIVLPNYVDGMFMGVIVRNINEKFKFNDMNFGVKDRFSDIFLNVFFSMAMMPMKSWQLNKLMWEFSRLY